ncbi:MAG TPA: DMT family transporter [Actinomycetota bacterium]|nr:DMT family transporter [Actinomycetota bacterium]
MITKLLPSARRLAARPGLAAVAGAGCIAFSAILVRLADVSPSTAAVFRCVYALPVLGALAAWERRRFGRRAAGQRRLALIAGLFFGADLVFWHYAIADVGAGLATVLGNVQVVFVALLAWFFLHERLSLRTQVAIPVALGGVVLISGVVGSGAYGRNPALGAVFGILTALAYSGFLLVLRQGNRDIRRPAGPLFDATLAGAAFSVIAGLATRDLDLVPEWPSAGWLVVLALTSQVVGWLLISISLPRLPAALTSIVLTLQPVGSVLLGVVLLDESPSALQLSGVGIILAAVLIATSGRRAGAPAVSPIESDRAA